MNRSQVFVFSNCFSRSLLTSGQANAEDTSHVQQLVEEFYKNNTRAEKAEKVKRMMVVLSRLRDPDSEKDPEEVLLFSFFSCLSFLIYFSFQREDLNTCLGETNGDPHEALRAYICMFSLMESMGWR